MPNLPQRLAIFDKFNGYLLQYGGHFVLSDKPLELFEIISDGKLTIRYGLQYLGKPQYCLIPDLIVADYGSGLNGEEAWDFLLHKSNLYPRADVLGYRHDGLDEMLVVKNLDLAIPPELVVFDNEDSKTALARTRFIITEQELPTRLQTHGTILPDSDTWKNTLRIE